jgi:hypothetical protein
MGSESRKAKLVNKRKKKNKLDGFSGVSAASHEAWEVVHF